MAVSVVHATTATLPDESGAEINKDQWNEGHTVTGLGTMAEEAAADYAALAGATFTGDVSAPRFLAENGTKAAPGLSFLNASGVGFYWRTAAFLGLAQGGKETYLIGTDGIRVPVGVLMGANGVDFSGASPDTSMIRVAANSVQFGPNTTSAASVTTRTQINKAVTGIADAVATATFTVTIPNGAHSAMLKVTLIGSLGAGGAIGANEATASISYDIAIARTAGVNATAAISSAYGSAATAVAGAATVTVAGALSAISGAVGATNTFTVNVTITKSAGSSANHTCLCYGRLMNANASGITIA